jgi:ABC-type proline/glycine betaine transport system permease subunit
VVGTVFTLLLIGWLGMWDDTMKTISMIFVCTVVALAVGLPIGIAMSRSDRLQRMVNPVLDVMQTMPSFVYLIPVVMLLGIGRVPGLIAVVIYAIPPVIRFTNLGIRLVDKDLLEAADAFGSSAWQRMRQVQLPLALPTIMAGVNQTIMLALSMVVIASMIGVQGLGQPVLKAITNQYFTMGLLNGMAIVGIAIIFDRVSQAYGKRSAETPGGGAWLMPAIRAVRPRTVRPGGCEHPSVCTRSSAPRPSVPATGAAGHEQAGTARRARPRAGAARHHIDMPAGGIQVVMGLSGSGKSTLIRHINRLIDPTAGEVLVQVDGQTVDVVKMKPGPAAVSPRADRHGVPEVRAVSAPDGAGERGIRPAGAGRAAQASG